MRVIVSPVRIADAPRDDVGFVLSLTEAQNAVPLSWQPLQLEPYVQTMFNAGATVATQAILQHALYVYTAADAGPDDPVTLIWDSREAPGMIPLRVGPLHLRATSEQSLPAWPVERGDTVIVALTPLRAAELAAAERPVYDGQNLDAAHAAVAQWMLEIRWPDVVTVG